MLKGLKELKEKQEQAQQYASEDRIKVLRLDDGDHARVRFLTDTDDIIEAGIHELEEISPAGKKKYPKRYCAREDTGDCQWCKEGSIPKKTMFLWAYVYEIMHKTQNPALADDPNAARWSQVKSPGGGIYYKEEVNGVQVFRSKRGKSNVIQDAFINYADEYGTWTDRDYKWSRSGKLMDTSYTLTPKEASKMTKEIKEIQAGLPDLAEYATGKIFSFASEAEVEPEPDNAKIKNNKDEDLF
jgi:hypothetical protein